MDGRPVVPRSQVGLDAGRQVQVDRAHRLDLHTPLAELGDDDVGEGLRVGRRG
ncbi:hypothetical protein [Herbidospora yilanensis]|uniref:hypothetical protein n=1 Tax=Herbidospora yilanensis TaxID=354426 RepID=UPI0012F9E220|nr:hypothetical protein [Herbidospora yilanensis]